MPAHAPARSCRSRSWARPPRELRAYIDGIDPITGRPVMQEVIEGLTRPFDDDELQKARLRAHDAAPGRAGHRGRTCTSCSSTTTGRTSCPIVLPTEERVAAMLAAHQPQAGRGGRPHAPHALPRSTGSTPSRRSRSTPSWPARRPEYFPVDPGDGGHAASARAAAPPARPRRWRSSTVRSATRSA